MGLDRANETLLPSLARLLPTLFSVTVLVAAAGWTLANAVDEQPARHRARLSQASNPILIRVETGIFETDQIQMTHVLYVVRTLEQAEQIIRDAADSDTPGMLLRRDGTWEGEASMLSLPSRRLAVVVMPALVPSTSAESLLFNSASEILASGGRLDVIDLR